MKRYAKRGIFITLGVAGMLFGSKNAGITHENEIQPILKRNYLAENDDTSSVTQEGDTTTIDGVEYTLFIDNDNNGIPDTLENKISEYAEKLQLDNTVFEIIKISGYAVLVVFYIMYYAQFMKRKTSSWGKIATEANETSKRNADTSRELITSQNETNNQVRKLEEEILTLQQTNKEQADKITELVNSNAKVIDQYKNIGKKMDTILGNQALMAGTRENTVSGVNAKVKSNSEGAIKYGEKTED